MVRIRGLKGSNPCREVAGLDELRVGHDRLEQDASLVDPVLHPEDIEDHDLGDPHQVLDRPYASELVGARQGAFPPPADAAKPPRLCHLLGLRRVMEPAERGVMEGAARHRRPPGITKAHCLTAIDDLCWSPPVGGQGGQPSARTVFF